MRQFTSTSRKAKKPMVSSTILLGTKASVIAKEEELRTHGV